jgi:homoserine acetyltransferase
VLKEQPDRVERCIRFAGTRRHHKELVITSRARRQLIRAPLAAQREDAKQHVRMGPERLSHATAASGMALRGPWTTVIWAA